MAESIWHVEIVNKLGEVLAAVEPSDGSWVTRVNGTGSGSHTFQIRDADDDLTAADWNDLTIGGGQRRIVVSKWQVPFTRPFALYWGEISDEVDVDDEAGTLTVTHLELRNVLSSRYGAMVPTYGPGGSFGVTNRSLRGAAIEIIRHGLTTSAPGDNWHYPLVLPAAEAGSFSKSWPHYELASCEEMLTDIQTLPNGPDIAFDPVWSTTGRIEHWARVGSPLIAGADFEWSYIAPETPVRKLKEKVSYSRQKSGVFVAGEGTEADMIVGLAGNRPGTPMMDRDVAITAKDAETQAEADAIAEAELAATREGIRQTSFSLHAPDVPIGDTFRLGARTHIWVENHWYLPSGWRHGYVVAISGNMTDEIGVEVVPL